MAHRTHDDPPLEYAPSVGGQVPLIVDLLKQEGIFPPSGTSSVSVRQREDGMPVLIYEVELSVEDWEKVGRVFSDVKREFS